jgi:hypothetical protein
VAERDYFWMLPVTNKDLRLPGYLSKVLGYWSSISSERLLVTISSWASQKVGLCIIGIRHLHTKFFLKEPSTFPYAVLKSSTPTILVLNFGHLLHFLTTLDQNSASGDFNATILYWTPFQFSRRKARNTLPRLLLMIQKLCEVTLMNWPLLAKMKCFILHCMTG